MVANGAGVGLRTLLTKLLRSSTVSSQFFCSLARKSSLEVVAQPVWRERVEEPPLTDPAAALRRVRRKKLVCLACRGLGHTLKQCRKNVRQRTHPRAAPRVGWRHGGAGRAATCSPSATPQAFSCAFRAAYPPHSLSCPLLTAPCAAIRPHRRSRLAAA